MFYDLNINVMNQSHTQNTLDEILSQLLQYGYRGVALTTEASDSAYIKDKSKKKTVKEESDPLPPPIDISTIKEKYPKLNIYRRINVILNDAENIRKVLQSKYIKHYDLLSFQPETQQVLKSLAGISNIDIVSYNPESKCSLSINRKLYNQFVSQNVYFELMYVPAVTSQSARRNLISLSHIYHAVGKSKNVIVSSGSYLPFHIRGPYDVMNFNLLFGLNEEQAKKAISKNCEKLLLKARKQRRGKHMFEMLPESSSMDKELVQTVNMSCDLVEVMEE